ncbi:hypothetical protein SAY87_030471 [Trapa incisa]|uniref:Uncharacterized protein n=1 Tax=Trapa incisa TaxID=236973 RepID=A0AAN7QJX9_9MYRT|nr:hypothetical protein SAY87_030471 [Trapa incisa]
MGLSQIFLIGNSLIFLMLFISTFLFSSTYSDEALHYFPTPSYTPSSPTPSQIFHVSVNNPPSPFLKNQRKRSSTKRKKIRQDKMNDGPFAAMLPKGTVPPSGSSACHNEKPDSVNYALCSLPSAASSSEFEP